MSRRRPAVVLDALAPLFCAEARGTSRRSGSANITDIEEGKNNDNRGSIHHNSSNSNRSSHSSSSNKEQQQEPGQPQQKQ